MYTTNPEHFTIASSQNVSGEGFRFTIQQLPWTMVDVQLLKRKNIKYLVFLIPEVAGSNTKKYPTRVYYRATILRASKDVRKLQQIGEWGVFALQ